MLQEDSNTHKESSGTTSISGSNEGSESSSEEESEDEERQKKEGDSTEVSKKVENSFRSAN